jgi:hypothetical protein
MSTVSDYITKHKLGRRKDYDASVPVILDLDRDRGMCFGMEITPSTGIVTYCVADCDGSVTKYHQFEKAFKHYNRTAGAENGLHLCH